MSDPALILKVCRNTATLRANLAAGAKAITALRRRLARLEKAPHA